MSFGYKVASAAIICGALVFLAAPEMQRSWAMMQMTPEQRKAVQQSVYYRNCDAARAAGAAPIERGEPGYREDLDGDSDGTACEPYY